MHCVQSRVSRTWARGPWRDGLRGETGCDWRGGGWRTGSRRRLRPAVLREAATGLRDGRVVHVDFDAQFDSYASRVAFGQHGARSRKPAMRGTVGPLAELPRVMPLEALVIAASRQDPKRAAIGTEFCPASSNDQPARRAVAFRPALDVPSAPALRQRSPSQSRPSSRPAVALGAPSRRFALTTGTTPCSTDTTSCASRTFLISRTGSWRKRSI